MRFGRWALLNAKNCRAMFCLSEWYRDLIADRRGPANQSTIVMWLHPNDPWPEWPAPEKYDLLISVRNGHRPGFLEHLAEVPESYRHDESDGLTQVIDYVAGMTDRYAIRTHDELFRPRLF